MSSGPIQPNPRSTRLENTPCWRLLVVDDEKDVHEVTSLAFRRKHWRKRPFELTSCSSAREARAILSDPSSQFHVALVDVVMETQFAGLDLCRFIRSELPNSLRIILRTGQPGIAPEERVINDYDIDYYLAKTEVTPEKLFAAVRSCLRSSQDIETLLAFSRQLRQFTSALQTITTDDDLMVFMTEGLKFLELKHQVRITFIKNIDGSAPDDLDETGQANLAKILRAHQAKLELGMMHPMSAVGGGQGYVVLFAVQVEGSDDIVRGGFIVDELQVGFMSQTIQGDLTLFMQNWTIAHSAVLLQQRVAREKLLNERMYVERIEGIANMVTGVSHEINTPLGVANTANGMILSLAEQVGRTPPGAELDELVSDLKESTTLMAKNIARASNLVRSFKQLSASQLSDERTTTNLEGVVSDCTEAMSVETGKRKIAIRRSWGDAQFPWTGYPGHLSQVLVNLIQNTLRYAYKPEDTTGVVDIRIAEQGESYVLEYEDYGAGVPPEIHPRMFEPFVTSGRDRGGTGLGLAIVHNIMTNLLRGQIACTTALGKGTKFVLTIPRVVPL
jgi:signal transduction histidine kinase/CheY-like chemotaxis protein